MSFWGAGLKWGETVELDPSDWPAEQLHISQATLWKVKGCDSRIGVRVALVVDESAEDDASEDEIENVEGKRRLKKGSSKKDDDEEEEEDEEGDEDEEEGDTVVQELLICSLKREVQESVSLDLIFSEPFSLSLVCADPEAELAAADVEVHLSGYFMPGEHVHGDECESEEEDEEGEEDEDEEEEEPVEMGQEDLQGLLSRKALKSDLKRRMQQVGYGGFEFGDQEEEGDEDDEEDGEDDDDDENDEDEENEEEEEDDVVFANTPNTSVRIEEVTGSEKPTNGDALSKKKKKEGAKQEKQKETDKQQPGETRNGDTKSASKPKTEAGSATKPERLSNGKAANGAKAAAPVVSQSDKKPKEAVAKGTPGAAAKEGGKEAAKTPNKDTAKTPKKDTAKTPTKDAANTPAKDAAKAPAKEDAKTPKEDTVKTPKEDTAKTPANDAAKTPTNDAAKSPAKDTAKTPAKEIAKTPAKEIATTPAKEIAKTAAKECGSKRPRSGEAEEGTLREEKNSRMKRITPEGLEIEEIALGKPDAKCAKPGKTIMMRYTGKLKKNGSVFDSNVTSKTPFKFRLGVGEVIKGWDIGVQGMRVGDKRCLTIPPSLGYGSRGAPPEIPGNASLVFDVELVDVK